MLKLKVKVVLVRVQKRRESLHAPFLVNIAMHKYIPEISGLDPQSLDSKLFSYSNDLYTIYRKPLLRCNLSKNFSFSLIRFSLKPFLSLSLSPLFSLIFLVLNLASLRNS